LKHSILLLSTYPYIKPRHGGQIRLANIAKTYQSAGWQVASIAIYDGGGYPVGPHDIPFPFTPEWRKFQGHSIPLIDDFLSGVYAASDYGGYPLVMKNLPKYIDAIHVEQPWLWPLAHKIQASFEHRHIILIYGSQNIETPLKKEILDSWNVSESEDVLEAIKSLEKQAAQESDICFAVTEADRRVLLEYGAKRAYLAPNGIEPWKAKPNDLERWRRKLPTAPWILYIASAHPPNFTGFTKVVGDSLGFIPPDSRLVIAGSVSEHINNLLAKTRWHALNTSRLQLLHILPDDDLAAVKSLAHAFLLPILHGGGSNIKTAEAIYSGSYVIGTTPAFRGYEDFSMLPEIMIADTPPDIQMKIKDVLQRPPALQDGKNELRQLLCWEKCLASIPDSVQSLMVNDHGK
jgi:hypothetical protein